MARSSSRIPGFYKQTPAQRRRQVAEFAGLTHAELALLDSGGLTLERAERLIENVVGLYSLPLGIAVNFQVNGRDVLVPMVIEEPSVVAACSYAARLAREGGGFHAESDPPVMIGQVQVLDVSDLEAAAEAVRQAEAEIGTLVDRQSLTVVELGGGFRGLEVCPFPDTPVGPMLVVHLLIDVRDAMGANLVNSAAEAVAPLIQRVTGGRVTLRILSNLADRRLARARCRVPAEALARDGVPGELVVHGIIEAQTLAEVDPYRAATHNKGILNGIDAVAVATGNDWRAVEAGAHAYAARRGRYRPLARWWADEAGDLRGEIELPLALGIVGGTTRANPLAQLTLRILGVGSAAELNQIAAAVGLAQNLGALRALATEGIQAGHMALHARQIAMAAGATGDLVDRVAEQMVREGEIRLTKAKALVAQAKREA